MNYILLSIQTLLKNFSGTTGFDVAVWPIAVVGILIILGIAAVIVLAIIISVKLLKRMRNRSNNTPQ